MFRSTLAIMLRPIEAFDAEPREYKIDPYGFQKVRPWNGWNGLAREQKENV